LFHAIARTAKSCACARQARQRKLPRMRVWVQACGDVHSKEGAGLGRSPGNLRDGKISKVDAIPCDELAAVGAWKSNHQGCVEQGLTRCPCRCGPSAAPPSSVSGRACDDLTAVGHPHACEVRIVLRLVDRSVDKPARGGSLGGSHDAPRWAQRTALGIA
jgi:hypothetical protein